MDDEFRDRAILKSIESAAGPGSSIYKMTRTSRTPMTFFLDILESDGVSTDLYWVDDGPPEPFCIDTIEPMPIAFSSSHVSWSAAIHDLFRFGEIAEKSLAKHASESAFLHLIADLSLRYGDADLAALAVADSIPRSSINFPNVDGRWEILEYEPVSEAYMTIWFGGLAHEVGHFPKFAELASSTPQLSDASVKAMIEKVIDAHRYPPLIATQVRTNLDNPNSSFSLERLKSEAAADVYACLALVRGTAAIMYETEQVFCPTRFLENASIFLLSNMLIQRCSVVARQTKMEISFEEGYEAGIAMQMAIDFRFGISQTFLLDPFIYQAAGCDFDPAAGDVGRKTIDAALERYRDLDSGLALAMQFFLLPAKRDSSEVIFKRLNDSYDRDSSIKIRLEPFLNLAEKLDRKAPSIDILRNIIN